MDTLKLLIELINKYGVTTGIFLIIAAIILIMIKNQAINNFFKKFGEKYIEKFFKKKDESTNRVLFKDSDIINHEIFNYIDFWLYSNIPTIKFKSDYRTVIFRKYLFIYFKQYRDSLFIFVNDGKYKELDTATLKSSLYSLFNDIVHQYESQMKTVEIPDIVISKMKSKNNETYTLLLELVNSVCDNHFYNTEKNMLKIFTILNILNATLEYTINVADEVCNNINGELAGMEYEGMIEPTKAHSYLDINEVKNDFIHIYIDTTGILISKILEDVILDDESIINFYHLIRSVNGDVRRLVLIDATSDWNITDKGKKLLQSEDNPNMMIARAVVVKTENQKVLFINNLSDSVPIKFFYKLEDAKKWLLTFK